MGLTCKTVGKFKNIMRKMENQLEVEKKTSKEEKSKKVNHETN